MPPAAISTAAPAAKSVWLPPASPRIEPVRASIWAVPVVVNVAVKRIFPAVASRSPVPTPVGFVWKRSVSSVSAATTKSASKAASRPSTWIASAPVPAVVATVSDAVGLAKVTDSPSVETICELPSAPPTSVSVIVSAAPVNENTRWSASRLSLTGSSPVYAITDAGVPPEPSGSRLTEPSLALTSVCVIASNRPLDVPFSSTSASPGGSPAGSPPENSIPPAGIGLPPEKSTVNTSLPPNRLMTREPVTEASAIVSV